MRDQYNRQIDYLRVSVTDRCNLRCVYCMPEEGVEPVPHAQILTFDEITRICRQAAELGISKIKLTGGEPLVRRGLPELVGMLKKIDGIDQVTLTTNGILLKDQIEHLTARGLDGVNISIDTLNPEQYRAVTRCGDVNQALEGMEAALRQEQLKVKINCVPLMQTTEEYLRLAELAKSKSIEVRFIEMMPIGMGKEYQGKTREEIQKILEEKFGKAEVYEKRLGNGPAVYIQFPDFKGRIGFISAVSHKFCDSCNRVRLTSEGFLKLCLQYETGIDLRKLLRDGATDEVLRQKMKDAILKKPACHEFGQNDSWEQKEKKGMSSIGG